MRREVDVGLLAQRLVPRGGGRGAAVPASRREALDRLQRDVALLADLGERLERLRVARVLHLGIVVRAEHRVEREALEAAPVHLGDREPVAGHADEAHEPFLARLDRGLEGAVGAERRLPLDHVHEVVQLDRVDVVDAEPVERAADLLARAAVGPLAGLGRHEELPLVALQPRGDAQLGVAVAGRDVDVVDAVLEQQLQRAVGILLGDAPQRRGAEDGAGRLVSGRPEGGAFDHGREVTPAGAAPR